MIIYLIDCTGNNIASSATKPVDFNMDDLDMKEPENKCNDIKTPTKNPYSDNGTESDSNTLKEVITTD